MFSTAQLLHRYCSPSDLRGDPGSQVACTGYRLWRTGEIILHETRALFNVVPALVRLKAAVGGAARSKIRGHGDAAAGADRLTGRSCF
jgi:hypothetical protein